MFKIATWFNNFNAPAVLMIDDLSDAYVNVYPESHKNDWGYLGNNEGSSFRFLENNLLNEYPEIKVTFFVPYLKHNVISDYSKFKVEKFALGEREEYTSFLKQLDEKGHEISHHGSNHGEYIDKKLPTTVNNWIHEWALFDSVESGVKVTMHGVEKFKEICDIDIVGGKYCGYISIDNSKEIIDTCNFLYWSEDAKYDTAAYNDDCFGKNEVVSFPTTVAGNSFVRLSYLTGDQKKDQKKKILKYFQPLYSIYKYMQIYKHYKKNHIISVQEHYSPSTTSGMVQSANVVSDITSLQKIFKFLQKLSIWYASCKDIATYKYVREHSHIVVNNKEINITFRSNKKIKNPLVSIVSKESFSLKEEGKECYTSTVNNGQYVVNLPIEKGDNIFRIHSGNSQEAKEVNA